jgi:hypothetical protein
MRLIQRRPLAATGTPRAESQLSLRHSTGLAGHNTIFRRYEWQRHERGIIGSDCYSSSRFDIVLVMFSWPLRRHIGSAIASRIADEIWAGFAAATAAVDGRLQGHGCVDRQPARLLPDANAC